MTQPRRDTPAGAPQVDRVREAMRYHDERLEKQDEDPEREDAQESVQPREGDQAEDSSET